MNKTLLLALFGIWASTAHADHRSFSNSGGSTAVGSTVTITSNVAAPAGNLTLTCNVTGLTSCGGGSFAFLSNDGTISINAGFTSGRYVENCVVYYPDRAICTYSFTGYISGTATVNGLTQAIIGITSQGFPTGGGAAQGTTEYNSAYTPFYYSDSEQILRSDDLLGTNQIAFGSQGSGVGQFYGAYGVALDAAGRIYVADTFNCRIVRIDDMQGTNWITYGGLCGSAPGLLNNPSGVAVSSTGRIYIMDTGNSRIVRMDDMTGTNWTSYGTAGSGVGQFSQNVASLALDGSGRIYIPDTGNQRLVRIDDMTGANWTVLTQYAPASGVIYSFQSPVAVSFDAAGRIYVADNQVPQPAVVRVDDMTGTNWTYIFIGAGLGLNSIGVDSTGTVFVGGGGVKLVGDMEGILSSSSAVGPFGPSYIFAVTPVKVPSPSPSAVSFSTSSLGFTQNVGTGSASQPVTVSNFGGTALNFASISASSGFTVTNGCPSQLVPGASCAVAVSFAPSAPGTVNGLLTFADDSGNLAAAQALALTGLGVAPVASVAPGNVTFSGQVVDTTSSAKNVVLQNTGNGPLQVVSIAATAPFTQTNNCTGGIAPASSCTVRVSFTPTVVGSASGTLTIVDNAGTQTVGLTGAGNAPVTFSPNTLRAGNTAVGNTSAPATVTLTNHEPVTLNFTSIIASAGFAVASNTCGTSIAAGATCTVGVTFTASALGPVTGTLTFIDDAVTSPQSVNLTGTGIAPITFSPNTLRAGNTAVGNTSAPATVTLTNQQNVTLNFTSIVASAGFAAATNTCAPSIAAGASCTVGVTFSPTAVGSASGTLTFTDDAAGTTQTVNLTGNGIAPVNLSPGTLNLGNTPLGNTSAAKAVTLTNQQNVTLNFTSIVASAGFAAATNTCGTSIAAGASCTVGVTFSPTAVGSASGTLIFTDDATGSTQTVSLTGTGTPALPASIAPAAGTPQSTAVNTAFAARLAAVVTDGFGNPVGGVTVTFVAPASGAGGSFAGNLNTAVTDATGTVTAPVFTANTLAGSYAVTAMATGVANRASFTLTNLAGPAAAIIATAGTPQSATIATAYAAQFQATVVDAFSNPVLNAAVTFTAPTSGASGTFAGGAPIFSGATNAAGQITSAAFTANTFAGSYTVTAAVAGVAAPAGFLLTNTAGPAGSIAAVAGSTQSATVNTAFSTVLQVQVIDVDNNPVPKAAVTFTAPSSGAGGSFGGSPSFSTTTNGSGMAAAPAFTANTIAGSYAVTATTGALSVSLNLSNTAAAAAAITAAGGTLQSAQVQTPFAGPLQVSVVDGFNNPVANVIVTFAAPGSGASAVFAGSLSTAITNSSGVAASAAITANTVAGGYTVTATVAGVATAAQFALTNTAGPPGSVAATAGGAQSATVLTSFGSALQAVVKDADGNPVSGVTVTFTAPSSGAGGSFATGPSTQAVTDGTGTATAGSFTANSVSGSYVVTATAAGVTAAANFALTNLAGAAAAITATAGSGQSATINTAYATQLQATVVDANNNPVPNATVTFTVPASGAGGTFAGGVNTAVTNAQGVATAPAFTANATAGSFTVTAAVAGVTATASFPLTNRGAAAVVASSGAPQSAVVNTSFASPLVVTVTDTTGAPVSGVTVTFAAPGSGAGGSFANGANTAVTNSAGVATSAVFTANTVAGSYAVTASTTGVTATASFALSNTAAAAASVMAAAGNQQSTTVNTPFPSPLAAMVTDGFGNPVSGVTVTFAAPASGPGASFAGNMNTAVTDATGTATAPLLTANTTAGSYVVTASAAGVATAASFQLTNNAAAAGANARRQRTAVSNR